MARARVDRSHPIDVFAAIERLTEADLQVLRLVAEHEVMSTEQLAALCFPSPARVADAAMRLDYLATRALLVKFAHPVGVPADHLNNRPPAGLPSPVPARWGDGRRWAWSLGQGGAYWAGVERLLSRDRWVDAWSRSFVPLGRPHLRRRLALGDFFAALHHNAAGRENATLVASRGHLATLDRPRRAQRAPCCRRLARDTPPRDPRFGDPGPLPNGDRP